MSNEKARNSEVHVAVDSVPLEGQPSATREWTRFLFYLFGGGIALMLLLSISESINPPDTALQTRDLTASLGFFDGKWTGQENLYLMNGEKYDTVDVELEFLSKNPQEQIFSRGEATESGDAVWETWNHSIRENGRLVSEPRGGAEKGKTFDGRWEDGQLFWHRNSNGVEEVRRWWIAGGVLHLEGIQQADDGSNRPMIVSGRFQRLQ